MGDILDVVIQNGEIVKSAVAKHFEAIMNDRKLDTSFREAQSASFVYNVLCQVGEFFNTNEIQNGVRTVNPNEVYFMLNSGVAIAITSDVFKHFLSIKLGINIKNKGNALRMYNVLEDHALEHGTPVKKRMNNYWDVGRMQYYCYNGDGRVYVHNGDPKPILVKNGTDGHFFVGQAHPFTYNKKNAEKGKELYDKLFNANYDEEYMSKEVAKNTVKYWFLSNFFRSEIKYRPMMVFYGPQRSGKTTLATNLQKLASTPSAGPTTMKAKIDDFYAVVSNKNFTVFDNADGATSPEMMDAIAAIVTGSKYTRRELYTTNNLYEVEVDTYLSFTTRTANLRSDVIDRSLMIHTKTLKVTSDDYVDVTEENWDLIKSALADDLNYVIRQLKANPETLKNTEFRMLDWAKLVHRINPDVFVELEKANVKIQRQTMLDKNDWIHIFKHLIKEKSLRGGCRNSSYSRSIGRVLCTNKRGNRWHEIPTGHINRTQAELGYAQRSWGRNYRNEKKIQWSC